MKKIIQFNIYLLAFLFSTEYISSLQDTTQKNGVTEREHASVKGDGRSMPKGDQSNVEGMTPLRYHTSVQHVGDDLGSIRGNIHSTSPIAPSALWELRWKLSLARQMASDKNNIKQVPEVPAFVKGNVRMKPASIQANHQSKTFRKATVSDDNEAEKFIFHLDNEAHHSHADTTLPSKESLLPQGSSRSKYVVDVDNDVTAKLVQRRKPYMDNRRETSDDSREIRAKKPSTEEPKLANAPPDVYSGFKPTLRKPLDDSEEETDFQDNKKRRKEASHEVKYPSPKFSWQKEIISTNDEDEDNDVSSISKTHVDKIRNSSSDGVVASEAMIMENMTSIPTTGISEIINTTKYNTNSDNQYGEYSDEFDKSEAEAAHQDMGNTATQLINGTPRLISLKNVTETQPSLNGSSSEVSPYQKDRNDNELNILGESKKVTLPAENYNTNQSPTFSTTKNENVEPIISNFEAIPQRSQDFNNESMNNNIENIDSGKALAASNLIVAPYAQRLRNIQAPTKINIHISENKFTDLPVPETIKDYVRDNGKTDTGLNVVGIMSSDLKTNKNVGSTLQVFGNIGNDLKTRDSSRVDSKPATEPDNTSRSNGFINTHFKTNGDISRATDVDTNLKMAANSGRGRTKENSTVGFANTDSTNTSLYEKIDTVNYSPPVSFIDNSKQGGIDMNAVRENSGEIPSMNSAQQREEENFIASALQRDPTLGDNSPPISQGLDLSSHEKSAATKQDYPSAPSLGNVLPEKIPQTLLPQLETSDKTTKPNELSSNDYHDPSDSKEIKELKNKDNINSIGSTHVIPRYLTHTDSEDNTFLQKMAAYDEFLKHVGSKLDDSGGCSRSDSPLKCENKGILKSSSVINALDNELSKISSNAINELNKEIGNKPSSGELNSKLTAKSYSNELNRESSNNGDIVKEIPGPLSTEPATELARMSLSDKTDKEINLLSDHVATTSDLQKEDTNAESDDVAKILLQPSSDQLEKASPETTHQAELKERFTKHLSSSSPLDSSKHSVRPELVYHDVFGIIVPNKQVTTSSLDELLKRQPFTNNSSDENITALNIRRQAKETSSASKILTSSRQTDHNAAPATSLLFHDDKQMATFEQGKPSVIQHQVPQEKVVGYLLAQRRKYQFELERRKLLAERLLESRKRQREIEDATQLMKDSYEKENMTPIIPYNIAGKFMGNHTSINEDSFEKPSSADGSSPNPFNLRDDKYLRARLELNFMGHSAPQDIKLYNELIASHGNFGVNKQLSNKVFKPKAFNHGQDSTNMNIVDMMHNHNIGRLTKNGHPLFHKKDIFLARNANLLMPFKAPHPKGPSIVFDQFSPAAAHALLFPNHKYTSVESPVSRTHISNQTRHPHVRKIHGNKRKTKTSSGPNYGYGSGNGYGYGTNSWGWGGGGGWAGQPPPNGMPTPGDFSPSGPKIDYAPGSSTPAAVSSAPETAPSPPSAPSAPYSASEPSVPSAPSRPSAPPAPSNPFSASVTAPVAPVAIPSSKVTYSQNQTSQNIVQLNGTTVHRIVAMQSKKRKGNERGCNKGKQNQFRGRKLKNIIRHEKALTNHIGNKDFPKLSDTGQSRNDSLPSYIKRLKTNSTKGSTLQNKSKPHNQNRIKGITILRV